eukprot:5518930-Prymnesium_polylepis.1
MAWPIPWMQLISRAPSIVTSQISTPIGHCCARLTCMLSSAFHTKPWIRCCGAARGRARAG